jgi:hypothetical protein
MLPISSSDSDDYVTDDTIVKVKSNTVIGDNAGVHETLDVTDETLLKVTETMERIVDTSSVVIDQDKIYTNSNAGNPYACIQRLEISFTDSLSKIQNSQDFNTTKILEAVTVVENLVKRNSNLLKSKDDNNNYQLESQVQTFKMEKDKLKIELQMERSNLALITANYEKSLAHEKEVHELTREDFQKLISSSIAENDFSINRLKEKNEEIEKLTNTVKQLTDKVDYLYDENLTLKSQIGSSFVHNPTSATSHDSGKTETALPIVYLLGTSNIKGIVADKLTNVASVSKFITYTIAEAQEKVMALTHIPDAVVFHVLTNDLKSMEPGVCVDQILRLIKISVDKWNSTKIVISLATLRSDSV